MTPTFTQEAKTALIEALKEYEKESDVWGYSFVAGITNSISIVESFPVSDGWIPVSERPEESRFYLVRCPGFCESGYEVSQFSDGRFRYEWNDLLHKEVTHYKPIR